MRKNSKSRAEMPGPGRAAVQLPQCDKPRLGKYPNPGAYASHALALLRAVEFMEDHFTSFRLLCGEGMSKEAATSVYDTFRALHLELLDAVIPIATHPPMSEGMYFEQQRKLVNHREYELPEHLDIIIGLQAVSTGRAERLNLPSIEPDDEQGGDNA